MKNLRIVLIGSGNVATQLAKAFTQSGCVIEQIYSRTTQAAKSLAKQYQCSFTTNLIDIYTHADLYVYAIKDDALKDIISSIKPTNGLHIHTAGSLSLTIFEGFQQNYGVWYPFQTFSKKRAVDFTNIPILYEGNTTDNELVLAALAKKISRHSLYCSSEQRKAVHLSGVFACNFTNHLYAIAAEILEESGLSFNILLPLISETAAKVKELSPCEAQTGPAVRYDNQIIEKHEEALANKPNEQEMYRLISKNIFKRSTH